MSVKDHRVRAHPYLATTVQLTGGNFLRCCKSILSPESPQMPMLVLEMGVSSLDTKGVWKTLPRIEATPSNSPKSHSYPYLPSRGGLNILL